MSIEKKQYAYFIVGVSASVILGTAFIFALYGLGCDFSRAFRHLFFTTIPPGPAL